MVSGQRQRAANDDTPSHQPWKDKHLWWGRIPLEDIDKHILVRDVRLSALGKLDNETIKIAAKLEIPHHEGAGGTEDFTNNEAFQRHIRKVSSRLKRKR
jgi:hypothetical protein